MSSGQVKELLGLAPQLSILCQFVRHLSFDTADSEIRDSIEDPEIKININVSSQHVAGHRYEVDLSLNATCGAMDLYLYNLNIVYSGTFLIENIEEENIHPFSMIECPRILFPYLRNIVSETIRKGGFLDVLIDPIDFVELYVKNFSERWN